MNSWTVIIVILQLAYSTHSANPVKSSLSIDYQADFAWDLYKKIYNGYKENMVISPYSLRKMFACIHQLTNPADPNLSTYAKELNKVFRLKQKNNQLDLIRRRYAAHWKSIKRDRGFNTTTLATAVGNVKASRSFRGLSDSCGFYTGLLRPGSHTQNVRKFNAAMKNVTRIVEKSFLAVSDIDPDWDFFIADSWKVNSLWRYGFVKDHITICNFYTNASSKGLMRFMYLEESLMFGHLPEYNVKAVELPFHVGSDFTCVLMMPVGVKLEVLIKSLNHDRFRKIYSSMTASKTTVRLPQFRLKSKLPAKSLLQKFGFQTAFNKSLFHIFDQGEAVPLGDIIQKVEISMNLKGEQAADDYFDRKRGQEFTAHQPFIFVVLHKKELVPIVVGHVVNAFTPKNIGPASNELLCDHPPKYSIKY